MNNNKQTSGGGLTGRTALTLRFAAALCLAVAAPGSWAATDQAIAEWSGHRMFEDFGVRTQMDLDGKWILRTTVDGDQELLSLPGLQVSTQVLHGGLVPFEQLVFCGHGGYLRLGSRGKVRAWYGPGSATDPGPATGIPVSATPACSADKSRVSYYTTFAPSTPPNRDMLPPDRLFTGTWEKQDAVALDGRPNGAEYAPDGSHVYAIIRQDDGASSLIAVGAQDHKIEVLAKDLDAWPFSGVNLAVAPDNSQIFLALATLQKPDDVERQKPYADRWLKIVSFDLHTKKLNLLRAEQAHDQTDPAIAGGRLYWVNVQTAKSVIALPALGGPEHRVLFGEDGYEPAWSRDGKRIAYVVGEYRMADYGLFHDVGIVNVDAGGSATGPRQLLVTGPHEDFTPDWSPNGKWIVFHAHRNPTNKPEPYYDAPGTTDDIYMRQANDTSAPLIRVTHGLWETGWVYWSPDGARIIYTTWDRKGEPGIFHVWTTDIDSNSGAVGEAREIHFPKEVKSPEIAVYSPSGKEIALVDEVTPGKRTLWIGAADGSKATQVVSYDSETFGGVDWAPDGRTLVYGGLADARMQIFAVTRTGGKPVRLTNSPRNLFYPRVSPDGKWIACSEVQTVQTLMRAGLQ